MRLYRRILAVSLLATLAVSATWGVWHTASDLAWPHTHEATAHVTTQVTAPPRASTSHDGCAICQALQQWRAPVSSTWHAAVEDRLCGRVRIEPQAAVTRCDGARLPARAPPHSLI